MIPDSSQAQQALQLAIAIEENNAHCFHDCAIRFMTYDRDVTLFLEELVSEERAHKQELIEFYERNFASRIPADIPPPAELQAYRRGLEAIREHFFVVDNIMAQTLLELALEMERYTRSFYVKQTLTTSDPEAQAIFSRLAMYEEDHEGLFLKRIEMMMHKKINGGMQPQYPLTI